MFAATKRVNIFKNGARFQGIVIGVPDTLEELLRNASQKLNFEAKVIYNEHGCLLDDIVLICNDDKLYIAGTEPFIPVQPTLSNACSCELSGSKTNTNVDAPNGNDAGPHANAGGDILSENKQNMIKLNVGGQYFCTSRTTLLKEPESMLAKMFSNELLISPSSVDESGAYFIDRSPFYFEPILNYLRDGTLIIDNVNPDAVFNEAKFYCIESLVTIDNRQ